MKIKITRTSVVEYEAKNQDLVYYAENEALNNDQIALKDVQDLEEDTISMEDIDGGGGAVEHTYTAVLVDDDLNEYQVDPLNTGRDLELFPIEDEEDEEDEKPVADIHPYGRF